MHTMSIELALETDKQWALRKTRENTKWVGAQDYQWKDRFDYYFTRSVYR